MATLTRKLRLTKPEMSDNIDPSVFADNFDIIDNFADTVASIRSATISSKGTWTSTNNYYRIGVPVANVLETDRVIIDVAIASNTSLDSITSILDAWSGLLMANTADGAIWFYFANKPDIDIPIKILIVGK